MARLKFWYCPLILLSLDFRGWKSVCNFDFRLWVALNVKNNKRFGKNCGYHLQGEHAAHLQRLKLCTVKSFTVSCQLTWIYIYNNVSLHYVRDSIFGLNFNTQFSDGTHIRSAKSEHIWNEYECARVWIHILPYDFPINLISFHVCPYKHLYKNIHKYSFILSIKIKLSEVGGACGTYGREQKRVQEFGGKARRKKTTCKTKA
jgi:hypothetical protein